MTKIVVHDYWRHFEPVAPTITVQTFKNVDTEINLRDIFVQGAQDFYTGEPDPAVIQAIGAQRGWLLNWFIAHAPQNGIIVNSDKSTGFTYRSKYDYIGPDCCTYYTHIGAQRSAAGRIEIDVQDYYSAKINVYRYSQTPNSVNFLYEAQPFLIGGANPTTSWVVLHRWYFLKPRRYNDPLTGQQTIVVEQEFFHGSVFDNTNYQMLDPGRVTDPLSQSWPDPYYQGFLAGTNDVYVQPEGPWPVILETEFHTQPIYEGGNFTGEWEQNYYTSTDIRTQLGDRWWESGLIQDI